VSADLDTDAWAVGSSVNPTTGATVTLTMRWNGATWSRVASPNPGGRTGSANRNVLNGVTTESTTDAWAVGYDVNPTTGATVTLIVHWNGTSWSRVASPNPGGRTSSSNYNKLFGVSALSSTDAWAVGYFSNPAGGSETLVLHWNGTTWSKVASPNPGGTTGSLNLNHLFGVSADSMSDAWAVGRYVNPTTKASLTLVLHCSGTGCSKVSSPNPAGTTSSAWHELFGISARSSTDAWSVGDFRPGTNNYETLVLHGNGTSWSKVTSPNPAGTNCCTIDNLNGVSAVSSTDI
jgi:membrane peptidoglycan carboxypeptidase